MEQNHSCFLFRFSPHTKRIRATALTTHRSTLIAQRSLPNAQCPTLNAQKRTLFCIHNHLNHFFCIFVVEKNFISRSQYVFYE